MKLDLLKNIMAGDIIDIDEGVIGTVVFNAISEDYSEEFPIEDWGGEANNGIMIQQENGALLFHDLEYLLTDYCRISVVETK